MPKQQPSHFTGTNPPFVGYDNEPFWKWVRRQKTVYKSLREMHQIYLKEIVGMK